MFSRLGIYALAAVGAGAIMIPPGSEGAFKIAVPPSERKHIDSYGVDPFTQLVQVPCPGCPFAQFGEKGVSWIEGQENYLVLNISVGSNPKALELNGVQFYPPVMSIWSTPKPIEVLQVPSSVDFAEARSSNVRLTTPARSLRVTSFGIQASSMHRSRETQEELININLSLQALEQQPISIHDVVIKAVKDRRSELLILSAEVSKEAPNPAKECQRWPLLCKWRQVIANRLEAMKHKMKGKGGCHKGKTHGMGAHGAHGKRPHHGRPHHKSGAMEHKKPHHKTHHGHHHHHAHNRKLKCFMHKAARIMLSVVIPILLGVLAGMLTYLVGMMVGTGLALVWVRFRRWRRGEYTRIALSEDDEEPRESFEKGEFVEEEFVEAPPVYVEVEANEITQK
jgi:hypothetical protein